MIESASLSFESLLHLLQQSRRVSHDQLDTALRRLEQIDGALVALGFDILNVDNEWSVQHTTPFTAIS